MALLLLVLLSLALSAHASSVRLIPQQDAAEESCGTLAHRLSTANDSIEYAASTRVAAIADTREQISNGPRTLAIGGLEYPLYYGPRPTPGSVTQATRFAELDKIKTFRTAHPMLVAQAAVNHSARLTALEAFADLHDDVRRVLPRPMSTDNRDATFGAQRLSIKSFALRAATAADLNGSALALSDWQLVQRCGLGASALALTQSLFVESFPDIAQFNDPLRPDKFVPNVVGFFCLHLETAELLPIEIRLLETGITYTPLDSNDEWTLAKMALESASVSYHQLQHMVETHAVTTPLRVEMLRTMSEAHPVRALVLRHVFADFALEMQAAVLLLNTSTMFDETFGWGATGATRFLWRQTQRGVSMAHNAFRHDLRRRGLDRIATHKYAFYGDLYWSAMHAFVGRFLRVYYASDADVAGDIELQHWALGAQTIPHVRDFPARFQTVRELQDLVTHLIFTSTIRHHGMNGAVTWHGMNVPFSPAALWHPLPTTKLRVGKTLNVLAYTVPPRVLPKALALSATFIRPVPPTENLFAAYKTEPFASEPRLESAIAAFHGALEAIDRTITTREAASGWPYVALRPADLAHYSWI